MSALILLSVTKIGIHFCFERNMIVNGIMGIKHIFSLAILSVFKLLNGNVGTFFDRLFVAVTLDWHKLTTC